MKSKKQKTLSFTKTKIVDLSLTTKLLGRGGDGEEIGQSLKTKMKRYCKSDNIYCNRDPNEPTN
ncbi:hypothetical protein IMCC3317_24760 [Kordia antarctica]|uniref:Uncharacterized protein n=1 Tax=Kordia antarctica TaxID=1218801 RepID=A0A7L4ZK55_9FLAO|nr:hypothetical protein [Kordia antarctica]QHI37098.1 hypothetical protein IMCC3317_24760 [Kordia antarctica]